MRYGPKWELRRHAVLKPGKALSRAWTKKTRDLSKYCDDIFTRSLSAALLFHQSVDDDCKLFQWNFFSFIFFDFQVNVRRRRGTTSTRHDAESSYDEDKSTFFSTSATVADDKCTFYLLCFFACPTFEDIYCVVNQNCGNRKFYDAIESYIPLHFFGWMRKFFSALIR